MPAKCFRRAMDIRSHISKQEAKAEAAERKATNRKKLVKAQEALKRAYEEVNVCETHP